jgi:hypothetical protein
MSVMHFGFWPETLEKWASQGHLNDEKMSPIRNRGTNSMDGSEGELTIWSRVDFMGDAFAVLNHTWPVADAMLCGCRPSFNEFAAWYETVYLPGDPPVLPAIEESNEYRQWMVDSVKKACIESRGRYFTRTDWGNFIGDVMILNLSPEGLAVNMRGEIHREAEQALEKFGTWCT